MRLIDADALMGTIIHRSYTVTDYWNDRDGGMFLHDIERAVNDQPTVDAVPIIRCRECRWGKEDDGSIECHVDLNIPSEYHGYDWYCPSGERKEE